MFLICFRSDWIFCNIEEEHFSIKKSWNLSFDSYNIDGAFGWVFKVGFAGLTFWKLGREGAIKRINKKVLAALRLWGGGFRSISILFFPSFFPGLEQTGIMTFPREKCLEPNGKMSSFFSFYFVALSPLLSYEEIISRFTDKILYLSSIIISSLVWELRLGKSFTHSNWHILNSPTISSEVNLSRGNVWGEKVEK